MPLWKCKNCMHEWEGQFNEACDWCGSRQVRILQKETQLEAWVKDFVEKQKNVPPRYQKLVSKHFWELV